MATNVKIKKALLNKLGVTPQRLSQLVNSLKSKLPMTTEQAVYTLAHDNGIDISKHLPGDELVGVRQLSRDLASLENSVSPAIAGGRASKSKPMTRRVIVSVKGDIQPPLPGMIGARATEAKVMAERVYPRLYLFENSLRELIERVLSTRHGDDWWLTRVPKKVRDAAARHKAAEARNAWHGKHGARELDYTLLTQLWEIIKYNWTNFKPLFPNQAWIEGLVTNDMNVSRRVIAHMNPLHNDDVRNIEAAYGKWVRQCQAIEKKLA